MTTPHPSDYAFEQKIPEGDNRPRHVCTDCGWIHYENPKVIVGAVCALGDRILLCKRAIEPRSGFWTLPAGFMEQGETAEDGAKREAYEEACAKIEIEALLAVYSIPCISQVQLFYKASLSSDAVAAGEESQEVALFHWEDIPWDQLAFPSVKWALEHYRQVKNLAAFPAFTNPPLPDPPTLGSRSKTSNCG